MFDIENLNLESYNKIYSGNCSIYLLGNGAVIRDEEFGTSKDGFAKYYVSGVKNLIVFDSRSFSTLEDYNKASHVIIFANKDFVQDEYDDDFEVIVILEPKTFLPINSETLYFGTIENKEFPVLKILFLKLFPSELNSDWTGFISMIERVENGSTK